MFHLLAIVILRKTAQLPYDTSEREGCVSGFDFQSFYIGALYHGASILPPTYLTRSAGGGTRELPPRCRCLISCISIFPPMRGPLAPWC